MKPAINCPFDDERLTDYMLGELADADRREVEQHLAECESCKMQLEQMREVTGLVTSVGSIEPPDGFAERIVNRAKLRAVARDALPAHAPSDRERRRKRRPRFGTTIPEPHLALGRPMRLGRIAVYAAACVALLLIYLARDVRKSPQPTVPRNDPASRVVIAPPTDTERVEKNGTLPSEPADDWLKNLPEDFDDVPEPIIAPPDPSDWHLRKTERELPDIMDYHRLPIRPREQIEPNLCSEVFRARTSPSLKKHYVNYIGGGRQAQVAVVEALAWLARHQDKDGKWDGVGFSAHCGKSKPCRDQMASDSEIDNVGLTAAVLLAFLGDGHTPNSGKFKTACAKGFDWLMAQQQHNGCIGSRGANHALAATALAEVYGMTCNRRYRRAAQRAMGFVLASGGDKFRPTGSDLAMGLEMLALRAGEFAGLDVPAKASLEIRTAMAAIPDTSAKAAPKELPPNTVTKSLLSGMYLMAKDDPNVSDASLQRIVAHLVNDRPDWKRGDMYYWFCGTLAMRQWLNRAFEKYHSPEKAKARDMVKAWKFWNAALRSTITENQARKGHERGSWEPRGELCRKGGRVLATALSTLTLESYYRYLLPE